MLDKEIQIRFTLRSALRWTWFGPVAVGILFLLFLAVLYAKWSTNSVAAWVQAVGSVLAILAAVWVAEQSHRRDIERADQAHNRERQRAEQAERDEEIRFAWVAECAAAEIDSALERLVVDIHIGLPTDVTNMDVMRVQQSKEILSSLLLMKLPHPIVDKVFWEASIASSFLGLFEKWHRNPTSDTTQRNLRAMQVEAYRDEAKKRWISIYNEYARLSREAGAQYTSKVIQ